VFVWVFCNVCFAARSIGGCAICWCLSQHFLLHFFVYTYIFNCTFVLAFSVLALLYAPWPPGSPLIWGLVFASVIAGDRYCFRSPVFAAVFVCLCVTLFVTLGLYISLFVIEKSGCCHERHWYILCSLILLLFSFTVMFYVLPSGVISNNKIHLHQRLADHAYWFWVKVGQSDDKWNKQETQLSLTGRAQHHLTVLNQSINQSINQSEED